MFFRLALTAALACPAAFSQTTLFVDASAAGAGDGSSWADAFATIDDALSAVTPATNGNSTAYILVAHGFYRPTVRRDASDPRSASIALRHGVTIMGGFRGRAAGPSASVDPSAPDGFPQNTILTGDNGTPDPSDDVYNVVHLEEERITLPPSLMEYHLAALERVTVRGGRADGDASVQPYQVRGGGLYFNGTSFADVGRLRLRQCLFVENYAAEEGGAIYFSVTPEFLAAPDSCFSLVRSFVGSNVAGLRGGGAFLARTGFQRPESGAPTGPVDGSCLVGNTFFRNAAGGSTTNLLTSGGAALWVDELRDDADLLLANNRAIGNRCLGRGSAYNIRPSSVGTGRVTIANETITANLTLGTAVVFGNLPEAAAALYFNGAFQHPAPGIGPHPATVSNCILWGNSRGNGGLNLDLYALNTPALRPVITYCNIGEHWILPTIAGGPNPVFPGLGNINADPQFAAPAALNFELGSTSPCADSGSTALVPRDLGDIDGDRDRQEPLPLDFWANPTRHRINGMSVDMGAFEL